MARPTLAKVRHSFIHFAEICGDACPLYAALAPRVADDETLCLLAGRNDHRQPPVNMLFGAVHYLLLEGAEHELASFYRSLDGQADPKDAFPVFGDFCEKYEGPIAHIVETRRVQTNEVGRCGLLLPAFGLAHQLRGEPLHLIEVGASAGLNLHFDKYRFEYSDGRACGSPQTVEFRTELRGPNTCPIPPHMPLVAGRIGVDIAPIDVTDAKAMRWVEALIWPDEIDRINRVRQAIDIARQDPPRLVVSDALTVIRDLIADVPAGTMPCVYHSHAIYQMEDAWQQAFAATLDDVGLHRDYAHISLEWLKDDPGAQLRFTAYLDGQRAACHLASCHHHGRWIEWRAS